MAHFGRLVEVGGLVVIGLMALVGSVYSPVDAYDGLFGVLGALGGFIAGRLNGMKTSAGP